MARWSGGTFTLGNGEVSNEAIASNAAIDADKMQHVYRPGTVLNTVTTGVPVSRHEIIHVAAQVGTIRGFHALLFDTGTTATATFDLLKNSTSVLSAAISITQADADRQVKDGTLSASALAADDVLSILMTVTTASDCKGPFAWVDVEENSAP